jgi:hypothetical protein
MEQSKRITAEIAIAATCAILVLVSGCQTTRSEAPVKVPSSETPQDALLSNSVRDRLLSAKTVDSSAVKVVSSSGTVYLTGIVTSLEARQQAVKSRGICPVCKASSTLCKCRNEGLNDPDTGFVVQRRSFALDELGATRILSPKVLDSIRKKPNSAHEDKIRRLMVLLENHQTRQRKTERGHVSGC